MSTPRRWEPERRVLQLELAGEYLLMAATLAEVKSRMLLPRVQSDDPAEESDPRAELVRRLVRCPAVERHERGRNTGDSDDIGAPSIGRDRLDLDEVRASPDDFFEAMNGGGHDRG